MQRALKGNEKCINYAVENDILKGIECKVGLFAEMMRLKLVKGIRPAKKHVNHR